MSQPALVMTGVTTTANLPNGITSIKFDNYFNQPLFGVNWPSSLHTLTFGYEFNQPISEIKWPQSLQTLSFGGKFDQPIFDVKWPPNLQTLSFGHDFNQPISEVKWSLSLQSLSFGWAFNQPISEVNWPLSLRSLFFGWKFNQPISTVKWPPSLQTLVFERYFDQPISMVKWPSSLRTLTFGRNFSQPICEVKWPLKIEVYRKYSNNIEGQVYKLIYSTPQQRKQREQLNRVLNKKNQPKNLSLPKPDQWTKWQQLCYKSKSQLTNTDRQQLQTYAKVANIANYEHLNATQLCVGLAQHLESYLQQIKTQPSTACQNDSTLEGDDFSTIPQEFIIQDDNGYCFTEQELSKLHKHPYTNQSWDQVKVKGQPILTYANHINPQLMELHQMFPSREQSLSVASLQTSTLTDIINHSDTSLQSTKYLHPNDLQKYETKPRDREQILSDVIRSDLSLNFVKTGGNSYLDWIDNLRNYIHGTPLNNQETIKYLIVELVKTI